jgi:hypothetical protein
LLLALHLIIPAHENHRLRLLPYFSDFLVILPFIYGVAAAGTTAIFRNRGLKFYASRTLRESGKKYFFGGKRGKNGKTIS